MQGYTNYLHHKKLQTSYNFSITFFRFTVEVVYKHMVTWCVLQWASGLISNSKVLLARANKDKSREVITG